MRLKLDTQTIFYFDRLLLFPIIFCFPNKRMICPHPDLAVLPYGRNILPYPFDAKLGHMICLGHTCHIQA